MRLLVTGGAGFIGSHVCDALLAENHRVAILDDLNDFYDPAVKIANAGRIAAAGGSFHHGDIQCKATVLDVMRAVQPDAVIHLAARAGVRPSLEEPELYVKTNVLGTVHVLEAMRTFGVSRLVFASSSSVYGDRVRVPFSEDSMPGPSVSPYAATKLAGEELIHTYSHLYGIRAVCLRFFTVYGPRQRPDLAIHKFYGLLRTGRPVPVYGDGSTSRDYTYIADIVRGVRASLDLNCEFDVINLGGGSPVRVRDLVEWIADVLGVPPVYRTLPPQPGDVRQTCADVSKARRLLGFTPEVGLRTGLSLFHEWYENEFSGKHAIPAPASELPLSWESLPA